MQTSRQEVLEVTREQRVKSERSLTEQSMKALRDYRRARYAERRLVAETKAA